MFLLVSFSLALIAIAVGGLFFAKVCGVECCQKTMKVLATLVVVLGFGVLLCVSYRAVTHCLKGGKGASCPYEHHHKHKDKAEGEHHGEEHQEPPVSTPAD